MAARNAAQSARVAVSSDLPSLASAASRRSTNGFISVIVRGEKPEAAHS
jgi:hypothetical protein